MYGEDVLAAIVPNSAKPFNFQKEFALTEEMVNCSCPPLCCVHTQYICSPIISLMSCFIGMFLNVQALRVSDHYPVEVELHSDSPFWMTKGIHRHHSIDTRKASVNRAVTGEE